jgi:hypothetical protein
LRRRITFGNRLLLVATVAALGGLATPAGFRAAGYAPAAEARSRDTLRVRMVERANRTRRSTLSGSLSRAEARGSGRALALGAVVDGYLSLRGLPPVKGRFTVTDSGLVFRSTDGSTARFPLVGPLRGAAGRPWRATAVSLAYIDEANSRPVYVFRLDAGVFQTDVPGHLLELAGHPQWLDSLAPTEWPVARPLVSSPDTTALWATARNIMASTYADSLYSLFGTPRAPVGLIGPRGRAAGRLGEYIGSRDSLALDPGRMTGASQLRHTLAHELAHRWQARAPRQVAALWSGVVPIRDPKRYGYGNVSEHQAEAIAFAINFLQTTATRSQPVASSLTLLDHYELLVPGTRIMARYLALQPIYRRHPLAGLLTTGVQRGGDQQAVSFRGSKATEESTPNTPGTR